MDILKFANVFQKLAQNSVYARWAENAVARELPALFPELKLMSAEARQTGAGIMVGVLVSGPKDYDVKQVSSRLSRYLSDKLGDRVLVKITLQPQL